MSERKAYFIKTFGCQMNEADSERLAGVFKAQGHTLAKEIGEAEVVVINTCSVRESAENRVFGLVRNLVKRETRNVKRRPKVILTGCMVGSASGKRRRYSYRQLKRKLPQVDELRTIQELISEAQAKPRRKKKLHVFVSIMEGCDHFCSYCVVPYARGEEISRPFEEIVCEVEELIHRGCQEITLLGQNVNSYGKSFSSKEKNRLLRHYNNIYYCSESIFALLLGVLHEIEGLGKISFLTSNPWDLTDEIIEAMALPKINRRLHLPVQSGDNEILKKMNRPYTAKGYIKLIKKIKRRIPEIKISTDLIVGFPGETKKQFENTVKLCQKIGFEKAYIAKYSPRPGTTAFRLKDNVLPNEKKRRWQVLEELINR